MTVYACKALGTRARCLFEISEFGLHQSTDKSTRYLCYEIPCNVFNKTTIFYSTSV